MERKSKLISLSTTCKEHILEQIFQHLSSLIRIIHLSNLSTVIFR